MCCQNNKFESKRTKHQYYCLPKLKAAITQCRQLRFIIEDHLRRSIVTNLISSNNKISTARIEEKHSSCTALSRGMEGTQSLTRSAEFRANSTRGSGVRSARSNFGESLEKNGVCEAGWGLLPEITKI